MKNLGIFFFLLIKFFFAKIQSFFSKGKDVTVEFIDDRGLIAVQGPESAKIVQSVIGDSVSKSGFKIHIKTEPLVL